MAHSKLFINSLNEAGSWRTGLPVLTLLLLLIAPSFALGGIEDSSKETVSAEEGDTGNRVELEHTFESLEALGRFFLEVLARGKREEIAALAVSKQEFADWVYPALPASKPGSNLSAEFVWEQGYLRNLAGLAKTMDEAGEAYEFVSIRFADGVKEYDGFRIHRDARLIVKDESGRQFEMDLFGSVMEWKDRYKIYSFVH